MTIETCCVVCGRPMPDQAYACARCGVDKPREQLTAIASMAPAARDVAHRQSSRGAGGSPGKPGSSPPIDFGVIERLDEIQNDLIGWGRHVAETRGLGLYVTTTGAEPITLTAQYLIGHLEWLRHRPEVGDALGDIASAARRLAAIINGPTPGRYAGPCSALVDDPTSTVCPVGCACHTGGYAACSEPGGCGSAGCGRRVCGEDVESRPGSSVARCRACGAEYDVDEQQAWMRGQIENQLARPVEISGVLLRLGFRVGYSTIAAYAARGRLAAHGADGQGRPLYRIGDVIDLRVGPKEGKRGA